MVCETYQSEFNLEQELISDLKNQGYEFLPDVKTPNTLLKNVRVRFKIYDA
jgi:type I restriction enzyme R subunit